MWHYPLMLVTRFDSSVEAPDGEQDDAALATTDESNVLNITTHMPENISGGPRVTVIA